MLKRSRLRLSWIFFLPFLLGCSGGKAIAEDLVSFQISNNSASEQTDAEFTIGHIFKEGDVAANTGLAARLSDGTTLNLQVDKKATHSDGSLRHAILSAQIPILQAQSNDTIILSNAANSTALPIPITDLANSGFDAEVVLQLTQGDYRVSLQTLVSDQITSGETADKWLEGDVVTEWQFVSPVRNDVGEAHPHLTARFYVRAYSGMKRIRVAVIIENGWTHVAGPQNINYDLSILIAGEERYSKQNITHFHHARWRKLFWWGEEEPQLDIHHDTAYLIASKAVPNYDQSLTVPNATIEEVYNKWKNGVAPRSKLKRNEIMGPGLTHEYFPEVGGRFDIGPLPRWSTLYLLSMDPRAKAAMVGTAEQAGSFSIHYRDQASDKPVTLEDYPDISSHPNISTLPRCSNCSTPYSTDGAHQPSLAYLPYLVTGDYFFLEELQFWSTDNMIESDPDYRDGIKGLVRWRQIRGQAWVLRTLARTAYITPDSDELKSYFTTLVNNSLDWYNDNYTNNVAANKLGLNVSGYAFSYSNKTAIAPWQDDYFTWSIGHIAELGFNKAEPFLRWKSISPISRMIAPGYCWLKGAAYNLTIRDTKTSPIFDSFAKVYEKNFGVINECATIGDMGGFPDSGHGYPATMQTALAVAVDSGVTGGQAAWNQFMSRTVKPDYSTYPNAAILPRINSKGPSLAFSASSNAISTGSTVTLTWSSPEASFCTASGDWSGSKANSGNKMSAALTNNSFFTLSCRDAENNTTTRTVNVSIISDTAPGVIEFSSSTQNVNENASSIEIVLERKNGSYGVVTAEWRTKTFNGYGDADWQTDYGTVAPWVEITFADGETEKTISIDITSDTQAESDETFTVLLRSENFLGSQTRTVVTIIDDDTDNTADQTPPVITLQGSNLIEVNFNEPYSDAGATAVDNIDGDIKSNIVTVNPVNTSVARSYTVTYNVSDAAGNTATKITRTVNVIALPTVNDSDNDDNTNNTSDQTPPVITLQGSNLIEVNFNEPYTDAGATAVDNIDGDITSNIVTVNPVNTSVARSYTVTYNVSDAAGNTAAKITRTVNVIANDGLLNANTAPEKPDDASGNRPTQPKVTNIGIGALGWWWMGGLLGFLSINLTINRKQKNIGYS